ncbi:MAG: hypothetical protein ACXWAT_07265 [Methylobacter sp.]
MQARTFVVVLAQKAQVVDQALAVTIGIFVGFLDTCGGVAAMAFMLGRDAERIAIPAPVDPAQMVGDRPRAAQVVGIEEKLPILRN